MPDDRRYCTAASVLLTAADSLSTLSIAVCDVRLLCSLGNVDLDGGGVLGAVGLVQGVGKLQGQLVLALQQGTAPGRDTSVPGSCVCAAQCDQVDICRGQCSIWYVPAVLAAHADALGDSATHKEPHTMHSPVPAPHLRQSGPCRSACVRHQRGWPRPPP